MGSNGNKFTFYPITYYIVLLCKIYNLCNLTYYLFEKTFRHFLV